MNPEVTPRVNQRPRRTACFIAATLLVLGCTDGAGPGEGGPLTILSGGSGNDTIDVRLPNPLVVEARGTDGELALNVEVIFRAFGVGPDSAWRVPLYMWTPPGGYALVVHDTTDFAGRASVNVGLGWATGEGRIVITAPALNAQTTARYTTRPGRPAQMVLSPTDTPIVVGRSYQIKANAVDRYENPVEGAATFTRIAGPIELSQDGTVRGTAVGRGEVRIQIGQVVRSAFTSVVPDATIAIRDYGRFIGDTLGFAQVSLDGSNHRWIAVTGVSPTSYAPSNALAPQWLPSGRELVYMRLVNGEMRLFIGDSTGRTRRLIEAPYGVNWEADADVTADGAWVYFDGRESTGAHAIWRVSTSGGTPERVTTSPLGNEFLWPSVSPDGTRLVYVSNSRAYVLDLRTGVATQLSANQAAGTVWSPTGEWILYAVSYPYAGYSGPLRVIRPDGTEDRPLGDGAYFPGGTWSPDGKYVIALGSYPSGVELLDVTSDLRLPLAYGRAWYSPAWRP
jgi:hypothetical protein